MIVERLRKIPLFRLDLMIMIAIMMLSKWDHEAGARKGGYNGALVFGDSGVIERLVRDVRARSHPQRRRRKRRHPCHTT